MSQYKKYQKGKANLKGQVFREKRIRWLARNTSEFQTTAGNTQVTPKISNAHMLLTCHVFHTQCHKPFPSLTPQYHNVTQIYGVGLLQSGDTCTVKVFANAENRQVLAETPNGGPLTVCDEIKPY